MNDIQQQQEQQFSNQNPADQPQTQADDRHKDSLIKKYPGNMLLFQTQDTV
jgi:hypothetical protein